MNDQRQEPVLSIHNVHKSYGKNQQKNHVLKGISLELYPSQILALLGANGSGKTTLINILSTLSKADSGIVTIAGYDLEKNPEKVRQSIGLTGQFAAVDEELTARENLVFFAGLQGLSKQAANKRATELLQFFRLDDVGDQLVREYSGGMKRRLDIAVSIVVTPKLLFLDEPTTGLDPVSRREVWEMVQHLKDAGVSIFLTTQYLEEAEELADQIYILRQGHIALEGSPQFIKEKYGAQQCQLSFNSKDELEKAVDLLLESNIGIEEEQMIVKDLDVKFNAEHGIDDLSASIQILDASDIKLKRAALQPASLESIFIDIAYQKEQIEGGR